MRLPCPMDTYCISRDKSQITGLILSGGEGRRMGGQDKGLVLFNDVPLIQHAIVRLAPQVETLLISANRNQDKYSALGIKILADTIPGYIGPLAGLHTGLAACQTEWLVAIPCDTPFFPLDLVAKMADTLANQSKASLSWARTPSGDHPVFVLIRKSLLPAVESYLLDGKRRVKDFVREVGGLPTHFEEESAFQNMNREFKYEVQL